MILIKVPAISELVDCIVAERCSVSVFKLIELKIMYEDRMESLSMKGVYTYFTILYEDLRVILPYL